jgi:hypothetical protein
MSIRKNNAIVTGYDSRSARVTLQCGCSGPLWDILNVFILFQSDYFFAALCIFVYEFCDCHYNDFMYDAYHCVFVTGLVWWITNRQSSFWRRMGMEERCTLWHLIQENGNFFCIIFGFPLEINISRKFIYIAVYRPVAKLWLCKQRPFLGSGSANAFLRQQICMQQWSYFWKWGVSM